MNKAGGERVCQMTILLHKPYLVEIVQEGESGVKKYPKNVHVVYGRPQKRNHLKSNFSEISKQSCFDE